MSEYDKLLKMLNSGKMSRRKFLAKAAALGIGAAISPSLLSSTAQASTPQKGGQFRLAMSDCAITDVFDPTLSNSQCTSLIQRTMSNALVEDAPDGLKPSLATSWESSKDVRTWTFKLREGVEFHNGKPFTSEDVLYSLSLHRKEGTKSQIKAYLKDVKEIKADGKHTVVITLNNGNVEFPTIMAFIYNMVPAGFKDFQHYIGTGAYKLVDNKPGVSTLLKKNPNYWNDKRGHFDEVKILGISDVVARTNALLTGKVDVISDPDLKTIKMLAKSPKVQIIQVPSKKHHLFVMNTTVAPYKNNDLRLALKYAINRKEIVDKVLGGYGTVANDHPISPVMRFYASELPQREFDPDKAQFHLKKAGMVGDTFTLSVANAPFGGAVDTAMLYQQQAAKAGVKIKVDRVPDDGYWKNVWMKKPFCASKWSGRLNEDMMLTTAYTTGAPWNESFWSNEKFDKILKEARTEKDDSKRAEMYTECQRLINEEGGSIIPVFTDFTMAASTKIGHGKVSGSWQMDGFLAGERWWFKK